MREATAIREKKTEMHTSATSKSESITNIVEDENDGGECREDECEMHRYGE